MGLLSIPGSLIESTCNVLGWALAPKNPPSSAPTQTKRAPTCSLLNSSSSCLQQQTMPKNWIVAESWVKICVVGIQAFLFPAFYASLYIVHCRILKVWLSLLICLHTPRAHTHAGVALACSHAQSPRRLPPRGPNFARVVIDRA
eukprot:1136952-Pelagomonas_calceolata.AAC.4